MEEKKTAEAYKRGGKKASDIIASLSPPSGDPWASGVADLYAPLPSFRGLAVLLPNPSAQENQTPLPGEDHTDGMKKEKYPL